MWFRRVWAVSGRFWWVRAKGGRQGSTTFSLCVRIFPFLFSNLNVVGAVSGERKRGGVFLINISSRIACFSLFDIEIEITSEQQISFLCFLLSVFFHWKLIWFFNWQRNFNWKFEFRFQFGSGEWRRVPVGSSGFGGREGSTKCQQVSFIWKIICWKDFFLWKIVNSNSLLFENNSCCTQIRKYTYFFLFLWLWRCGGSSVGFKRVWEKGGGQGSTTRPFFATFVSKSTVFFFFSSFHSLFIMSTENV